MKGPSPQPTLTHCPYCAMQATEMARFDQPIEPMTLGNMRELGVRSLDVSCWNCHHQAVLSADHWPGDVAVPTFGPRMVCISCGIVGAITRPHRAISRSGRALFVR
jgi:hypothetical protein